MLPLKVGFIWGKKDTHSLCPSGWPHTHSIQVTLVGSSVLFFKKNMNIGEKYVGRALRELERRLGDVCDKKFYILKFQK